MIGSRFLPWPEFRVEHTLGWQNHVDPDVEYPE